MTKQRSTRAQAWRLRREEYLRAANRCEDLVREGFEDSNAATEWTVVQGGLRGSVHAPRPSRLILVSARNPSEVNK
jgi:hypothetical protein